MDKNRILQRINDAVLKVEPKAEIILFGSRARGDAKADSDWDLLVLVPYDVDLVTEQKFRHTLFDLELEFGASFSTFVYSKSIWEKKYPVTPFYKNIKQEGIRL